MHNNKDTYLALLDSFCNASPIVDKPLNLKSLPKYFAERVSQTSTQDVLCVLSGERGSGKSVTAVSLAKLCADELSIIDYGDKSHSREYFNIENVASIKEESLLNLIGFIGKRKRQVIILDDASLTVNNRNSMSVINKIVNDVLTISRTQRDIVILTSPSAALVDLSIRRMMSFKIHIIRSNHSRQYNVCTVMRCYFNEFSDKVMQKHLTALDLREKDESRTKKQLSNIKLKQYRIFATKNNELLKDYDKLREAEARIKILECDATLNQAISKKREELGLPKTAIKVKKQTCDPNLSKKIDEVNEMVTSGIALRNALKLKGISTTAYYKAKKEVCV